MLSTGDTETWGLTRWQGRGIEKKGSFNQCSWITKLAGCQDSGAFDRKKGSLGQGSASILKQKMSSVLDMLG